MLQKNIFHSAQPHQVQIHHNHHSPDFPTNIRGRSANGVERSKEGRENERLVYYCIKMQAFNYSKFMIHFGVHIQQCIANLNRRSSHYFGPHVKIYMIF